MRAIIKVLKSGLAIIISVYILSLFVVIYGFSGVHVTNASGATDYCWNPHQWKSTMTEGFSWFHMDSNGFNNLSVPENVDVLIMGSSHMEAINVNPSETTTSLLSKIIPEYAIYNIGISGHEIYQCSKNLKSAINAYSPSKYVIIETDRVSLDNNMMRMVLNEELTTIPSYNNGVLVWIQKYCPAIKTMYKHINDWRNMENTTLEEQETMMDYQLLTSFLHKMKTECGDAIKLIIFFHPSTSITSEGVIVRTNNNDIEQFAESCIKNDIVFLDLSQPIYNLYDEKCVLAHGFINTSVGIGHLNSYGHQIIAENLAKYIMEDQQK